MRYSWLLLLAGLTCVAQASEVYQYIDEHGNRVFTDRPPLNVDAEEVKLPAVNSTRMPAPERSARPDSDEQAAASAPYQQLALVHLPEDDAIRANNGNLLFQVQIQPGLSLGHRLQLLVDGQPHGAPIRSIRLQALNLDRGDHRIAVQVLAGEQVVQQSAEYPVSIQRTHINAPARRAP